MTNIPNNEERFMGLTHGQVFVYTLMTVISILFLFITNAYLFRMNFEDWNPVPIPSLLWVNTGALVLASVGMAWAKSGAKRSSVQTIKVGLIIGGLFAVTFVTGQTLAWQELTSSGYFLTINPANTFFYLITALHAMHVIGGVVAWLYVTVKTFKQDQSILQPESIGLLGSYWHYMLLVWILLFMLLLTT